MKYTRSAVLASLTLIIAASILGGSVHAQLGGKWGGRRGGLERLSKVRPEYGKAIEAGLAWLLAHQNEQGSWDAATFMRHDPKGKETDGPGKDLSPVGVTSLVVVSLLAEGNRFRDQIDTAIAWLMKQQRKDGSFPSVPGSSVHAEHALAAFALLEASAFLDNSDARSSAGLALDHLLFVRRPEGVWAQHAKSTKTDMLATYWAVCAMRTGIDFRLTDPGVLDKTLAWLRSHTDDKGRPVRAAAAGGGKAKVSTVGRARGRATPKKPTVETGAENAAPPAGWIASENANLAINVWCRFFLGAHPEKDAQLAAMIAELAKPPAAARFQDADLLHWWIGMQSSYQVGGRHWQSWSTAVVPRLVEAQRTDGGFAGSWDPVGRDAKTGGRVYATALSVLSLQTYYRYTRLVR